MMTSAQVVETSVTTTDNSPSQDYTHPDYQTTLLHVTPAFKPFTMLLLSLLLKAKLSELLNKRDVTIIYKKKCNKKKNEPKKQKATTIIHKQITGR